MGDAIPGGLAQGMKASDFDPYQLQQGTEVELEHTSSRAIAQEIAMDHLVEDPEYYEKLATIHDNGQWSLMDLGLIAVGLWAVLVILRK